MAYYLLCIGADPNHRMVCHYGRWGVDVGIPKNEFYNSVYSPKSPIFFAKSEAMKKLLEHFGGLPTEEAEKIWNENDTKKEERVTKRKKEKRLAKKHERDNLFVNNLIR